MAYKFNPFTGTLDYYQPSGAETDPVFTAWLATSPLAGYVPTSRTLTINGTTYDLSANRTWTIPADQSFGTTTQIPYMNAGGTDFLYSANLTFNGSAFACQASAVFNEAGADVDFRIEGDTDANLFMLDASTDRIGIGIAAPLAKLHTYRYLSTRDGNATHIRSQEYTDWLGAVGNVWYLDCDFTDYRRLNSGTTDHVYLLDLTYNRNSAATLSTPINSYVDAFPLTITDNANFTATDHSYLTHRGGNVQITQNYKVNLTAGKNLTYIGVAYDTYLQSTAPTVTTGNLNAYYYSFRAAGVGHTAGTHKGYAFYNSLSGFDELWCAYNNTASPSLLGLDSSKQYLGTGRDAYFEYNGTDLCIAPKALGSGVVNIVQAPGSAPASTIPAAWLDVKANGTAYKLALYQ